MVGSNPNPNPNKDTSNRQSYFQPFTEKTSAASPSYVATVYKLHTNTKHTKETQQENISSNVVFACRKQVYSV